MRGNLSTNRLKHYIACAVAEQNYGKSNINRNAIE